jgi:hypothetical protein
LSLEIQLNYQKCGFGRKKGVGLTSSHWANGTSYTKYSQQSITKTVIGKCWKFTFFSVNSTKNKCKMFLKKSPNFRNHKTGKKKPSK